MYGTYWKTKEGKEYFQSTVPSTSVDWGHYSMEVYNSLVDTLSEDKTVELVISFQEWTSEIYFKNKYIDEYKEEEKGMYREIQKTVMDKHGAAMKAIYENDVEEEEEEGTYGSCELCEYEGSHTFYSPKKDKIVKVELND